MLIIPSSTTPDLVDPLAHESDVSQITLRMGEWIMRVVDYILGWFDLGHDSELVSWIYVFVVFAISFGVGYLLKWIVQLIVAIAGRKVHNDIYVGLSHNGFFSKLCSLLPPTMFLILIQLTLQTMPKVSMWLTRLTAIYISIILAITILSLIDTIWKHVDDRNNRKKLPLKGIVQLAKGILWLIVLIVDVSLLVDKSPTSLLAGLGAFAAVLMLVFKDSILGVVAGVQLAENDSLHVGDWIKVHGTDANGIVSEVTLTTVKILNFDKTTVSLPPYSLISGSFTNYRSMSESNTRRIMRSWMIDADSIVPLDDALRERISAVAYMTEYFSDKNAAETNLGAFREYIERYLKNNPDISHDDTIFVTTLAQTSSGVPLQLYCFTSTSSWVDYEHRQASVFEHVAIMLAKFNLYTIEMPSGRDTIIDGYMSNGRIPDGVLGIPYPFYMGSEKPENPGAPPSEANVSASSDKPA